MKSGNLHSLIERYRQLSSGVINFDLLNLMVHTHHSTAIEGSTLTFLETQTLIEKGLTAAGKPLSDHLMILDHQEAFQLVLEMASQHEPLNRAGIQRIAAAVMRQTGGQTNTLLGNFDSSKGDLRTVSVMAGSRMFMDARKVPAALDALLVEINKAIAEVKTPRQLYDLSFMAHYQLVTIHPFGDGNGRTARLLMNYMQHYHNLPLSLVYAEERTNYIGSLEENREKQTPEPMLAFMHGQLEKFLQLEIQRLQPTVKQIPRRLGGLTMIF